jgi:hypothetical protein
LTDIDFTYGGTSFGSLKDMLDEMVFSYLTAQGKNDLETQAEILAELDSSDLAFQMIDDLELEYAGSEMEVYGFGTPELRDAFDRLRRDRVQAAG